MTMQAVDRTAQPWDRVRDGVGRERLRGGGRDAAAGSPDAGSRTAPPPPPDERIACIRDDEIDFHIGREAVCVGTGGVRTTLPATRGPGVVIGGAPVSGPGVHTPRRDR